MEENVSTVQKKIVNNVIIPISKLDKTNENWYVEKLEEYKPLSLSDFVFGVNNKIKNKYMFYYKNRKQIIPFLRRKDKKIDFKTFVFRNSPHILKIKDLNRRLENFFKTGTQFLYTDYTTRTKPKIKETFESYLMNSLEKRISLYLEKQKLFIRLLEIEDIIKGKKMVNHNDNWLELLKEREDLKNKIEKLKIKIYETQKYK